MIKQRSTSMVLDNRNTAFTQKDTIGLFQYKNRR